MVKFSRSKQSHILADWMGREPQIRKPAGHIRTWDEGYQ